MLNIDSNLSATASACHIRMRPIPVVRALRMAGIAFAAIASWASVPRMNGNHIRSMLMGVLGLAVLL